MTTEGKTLPKPGDRVTFEDDGALVSGICNGEPLASGYEGETPTHVPVYVHDGDRCMIVHVNNLRPS